MTKDRNVTDSGSAVTTKENVTPVVTTVSYTTPSTITVASSLGAAGFEPFSALTIPMKDMTLTTEPKVGWIYDMDKESIVSETSKYGLATLGNVETLRRRFCHSWRNGTLQISN